MARSVTKMSWEKYVLRPVQGAPPAVLPTFIYGTAWKKDHTPELVHQALQAGFRAVDTAAQPKHYREDLVGEGIRRAIRDGTVRREDLHVYDLFLGTTVCTCTSRLTQSRSKPNLRRSMAKARTICHTTPTTR